MPSHAYWMRGKVKRKKEPKDPIGWTHILHWSKSEQKEQRQAALDRGEDDPGGQ